MSDPEVQLFIQEMWRDSQVPLIDGVLLDTGVLYAVEYFPVTLRGVKGVGARLVPELPSSIQMSEDLATIDELDATEDPSAGLRYSCGEGSYGSDGYLACTNLSDGALRWLAFLQQSNPFVQVRVREHSVEATNNHGHVWTFSQGDPLQLRVG